jgi:hypothetical protein
VDHLKKNNITVAPNSTPADCVVSQRSIASMPPSLSDEGRLTRRIRDEFKSEECFICTEGDPNIVTLCCDQAVHCDCLTKWLQAPNRANCPYCRAILRPSVSHQQEPSQPEVRSSFVREPASSDVQDRTSTAISTIALVEFRYFVNCGKVRVLPVLDYNVYFFQGCITFIPCLASFFLVAHSN